MTDSPYRDGMPGYYSHAPETSRDASESVAAVANSIRAQVRRVIYDTAEAGITADDIAARLDLTVYQVRARVAELHTGMEIADSGRRGIGGAGRKVAVWVAKQYDPNPEPASGQGDLWGEAAEWTSR